VLGGDALPQLDQLLLRVGRALEAAVQRQLDRLREHQLAARVLGHRAARGELLVDGHEAQPVALGLERAGQPAGPAPTTHRSSTSSGSAGGLRGAPRDLGADRHAVLDGGLDQRVRGDLAGQEQARGADRLEALVEHRHVAPLGQVAERDRDRAHRALALAGRVTDAARAVDDHGLAVHEVEHTLFGTGAHAAAAAQAAREVDHGMAQHRRRAALAARHARARARRSPCARAPRVARSSRRARCRAPRPGR
jgi:hypothetical protein